MTWTTCRKITFSVGHFYTAVVAAVVAAVVVVVVAMTVVLASFIFIAKILNQSCHNIQRPNFQKKSSRSSYLEKMSKLDCYLFPGKNDNSLPLITNTREFTL
jgi:hypothetical protein